jgi:AAA family ATP:ADP antiporter
MSDNQTNFNDEPRGVARVLKLFVDVRAAEVAALLLAFVYYFLILSSYYVLRPIRDEIGAANGTEKLPWMYTGTLLTMLVANALFSALVSRYTRRRFIPIAYRFLIFNLGLFILLFRFWPQQNLWIGRVFFVWVSVFNLFALSVFWSFMADTFDSDQGKRLFGFLSVGGTLGAIAGSLLTSSLVQTIGALKLLAISAVLIELSVWCVRRFPAPKPVIPAELPAAEKVETETVGGGFWSGIWRNFSSPYLLGISAYMLLYTITSTVLTFQQASIAGAAYTDRAVRTAFFAKVDLIVNVSTIVLQIFITGRLIKKIGVGATLAILPILSVAGFLALGFKSVLALLVVFLVIRRAGNFALARPAREVLFTVIPREDKYKSKNFIDTFIYRAGDQVGAWSFRGLQGLGLSLGAISLVAAPLAAIWTVVSIWLGWRQAALARESAADQVDPPK